MNSNQIIVLLSDRDILFCDRHNLIDAGHFDHQCKKKYIQACVQWRHKTFLHDKWYNGTNAKSILQGENVWWVLTLSFIIGKEQIANF